MNPDGTIQNAANLDLVTVLEVATDEIILGADLMPTIQGVNPFTGTTDTVSYITNLVLVNEGEEPVTFGTDSAFTTTVVLQ